MEKPSFIIKLNQDLNNGVILGSTRDPFNCWVETAIQVELRQGWRGERSWLWAEHSIRATSAEPINNLRFLREERRAPRHGLHLGNILVDGTAFPYLLEWNRHRRLLGSILVQQRRRRGQLGVSTRHPQILRRLLLQRIRQLLHRLPNCKHPSPIRARSHLGIPIGSDSCRFLSLMGELVSIFGF